MKNNSITVILNSFKRQEFLDLQIDSIKKQSVKVDKIMIWNNGHNISSEKLSYDIIIVNSSFNFGVWARFAFALHSETEYICILDDDTFPGELFFSNCLSTMESSPALLGARGLRFLSSKYYEPYISFGWDNPNEQLELVDIVGHAWFFKREWLKYFWTEMPLIKSSRLVGEDMHFSFMLRKYAGINTMVPPHPKSDTRYWGSDPYYAYKIGTDKESISQNKKSLKKFDKALRFYTNKGIPLCKDNSELIKQKKYFILPRIFKNRIFKIIIESNPIFKSKVKKIKDFLFKNNISI